MSAKLFEYRDSLQRELTDKTKPWTKYFDQLETKTGVGRLYIFVGMLAFTGLYLVFGFGAELICNTIGFVYPAYMSMKALESPQKDDDTKWLTYWVVYACFSIIEYFSDFIVGWFPMYWLMKCIFVIWCYMPTDFNGSLIIYNRIIRPYYQKHHAQIDAVASAEYGRRLPANMMKLQTPTQDAKPKAVKQAHDTEPTVKDSDINVQELVQDATLKIERSMRKLTE